MEFHSGRALREAAERRVGRQFTADEWAKVDPEGSYGRPAAYDENDLDVLLSEIANRLPRQTETRDERVRAAARERTQRTARDVRELVEDERYGLFDARAAPFSTVADAARWIEDQQAAPERVRLALTVDLPEQDLGVELLRDLRDWLDRVLEASGPDATYADFLRDADGLHSISTLVNVLPYLPGDASSGQTTGVKRVHAPPGSRLERVLLAAQRVAAATGWSLVASLHHLLTGGLMSSPLEATSVVRAVRGTRLHESVDLHVPAPSGVDAETVTKGYVEARSRLPSGRQRANGSHRADGVVEFIDGLSDKMSWTARLELWNSRHPDHLYPTKGALRMAYRRAGRARRGVNT